MSCRRRTTPIIFIGDPLRQNTYFVRSDGAWTLLIILDQYGLRVVYQDLLDLLSTMEPINVLPYSQRKLLGEDACADFCKSHSQQNYESSGSSSSLGVLAHRLAEQHITLNSLIGCRANKYDAKADLWSVGTVLFEMMCALPPFRANNDLCTALTSDPHDAYTALLSDAVIEQIPSRSCYYTSRPSYRSTCRRMLWNLNRRRRDELYPTVDPQIKPPVREQLFQKLFHQSSDRNGKVCCISDSANNRAARRSNVQSVLDCPEKTITRMNLHIIHAPTRAFIQRAYFLLNYERENLSIVPTNFSDPISTSRLVALQSAWDHLKLRTGKSSLPLLIAYRRFQIAEVRLLIFLQTKSQLYTHNWTNRKCLYKAQYNHVKYVSHQKCCVDSFPKLLEGTYPEIDEKCKVDIGGRKLLQGIAPQRRQADSIAFSVDRSRGATREVNKIAVGPPTPRTLEILHEPPVEHIGPFQEAVRLTLFDGSSAYDPHSTYTCASDCGPPSDELLEEDRAPAQTALDTAWGVVKRLLVQELLGHALRGLDDGGEMCSTSTSSSHASSTEESVSLGRSSCTSSSRNGPRKRMRGSGGDPFNHDSDEDGSSDDRPKKRNGKGSPDRPPRSRVKCPFYQRQPEKYCKAACRGEGFIDMAKLKDHIKRVHTQPLRCFRCWLEMKSEESFSEHLQEEVSCKKNPQPQDDRLHRRFVDDELDFKKPPYSKAKSIEEKWCLMYKLLFPDDAEIPSPFERPGMTPHFLRFITEELEEELTRELAPSLGPAMARIKGRLPVIMERCRQKSMHASLCLESQDSLAASSIPPDGEQSDIELPNCDGAYGQERLPTTDRCIEECFGSSITNGNLDQVHDELSPSHVAATNDVHMTGQQDAPLMDSNNTFSDLLLDAYDATTDGYHDDLEKLFFVGNTNELFEIP